jgi:uncharacterized protein
MTKEKPVQASLPQETPVKDSTADFPLLKIAKTIRVAATGDVLITSLEREIIDTADFQRLRRIRQLGTVNIVYPTALHTRFDHSLGTLAMAARMIRAIRENTHSSEEEREINPLQEVLIRLYALLHDVPHVPFGHTIEDELGIFERHDKNPDRFQRFFGPNSEIGKLIKERVTPFDAHFYDRFTSLYRWNGKLANEETEKDKEKQSEWYKKERSTILKTITENDDAFVYDIVSNTICADLLDYLARDSYFCDLNINLEYRFLNFLCLQRNAGEPRRVFVRLWKGDHRQPRRDTLTDLARLLEARYIVAERAYFHHAKIISGAMLGRALQEAEFSKELKEADLYDHSDDTLIFALANSKNAVAKRLGGNLLRRKLHKSPPVFKYTREGFEGIQQRDYEHSFSDEALRLVADATNRLRIENQLAEQIGVNPGDVIVYAPQKDMNLKAAEMKVIWKGEAKCLKDIDDPVIEPRLQKIVEAHRMLWAIHVLFEPNLSKEKQARLRQACDILFACSPDDQEEAQRQFIEDSIEDELVKTGIPIPSNMAQVKEIRAAAAKEMMAAADDKRSWSERIQAVTKKYFATESKR